MSLGVTVAPEETQTKDQAIFEGSVETGETVAKCRSPEPTFLLNLSLRKKEPGAQSFALFFKILSLFCGY